MNFPVRLAFRHVFSNKTRNGLTILAITIAVFLLCFLWAVVRGIDAGVRSASSTRLVTQSAVSLFVSLPMSYRPKIDAQDAVAVASEFRWFGGYYQDPSNFFPQFAVNKDHGLKAGLTKARPKGWPPGLEAGRPQGWPKGPASRLASRPA